MHLADQLLTRFKEDDDIFVQRSSLAGKPVIFIGYKSLIDMSKTVSNLQMLAGQSSSNNGNTEYFMSSLGKTLDHPDEKAILAVMLGGSMIVLFEQENKYVEVLPFSATLNRAIQLPTNESVLQGPVSAFNENISTNIGIVKRYANSERLLTKIYTIGGDEPTSLALLYHQDTIDKRLLGEIMKKIKAHPNKNVKNLQQLSRLLGLPPWSAIPKFHTTEMPQEAANAIREGKVVIFMEQYPFALVMPNYIWNMFALENDRNYPRLFMGIIRFLRITGVLTSITIPALYVALVSVNPEVLQIELALSIAESRANVPYPAFVETLQMLFILELTIEASVRLPKSVATTITMVGGIVLGQAIVAAKLVSNLLIILLAATTIANSTVIGFQNSIAIRLFKYVILILASFYGVLGLFSGLMIVCAYLASATTLGVPYLHIPKPKGDSSG